MRAILLLVAALAVVTVHSVQFNLKPGEELCLRSDWRRQRRLRACHCLRSVDCAPVLACGADSLVAMQRAGGERRAAGRRVDRQAPGPARACECGRPARPERVWQERGQRWSVTAPPLQDRV